MAKRIFKSNHALTLFVEALNMQRITPRILSFLKTRLLIIRELISLTGPNTFASFD